MTKTIKFKVLAVLISSGLFLGAGTIAHADEPTDLSKSELTIARTAIIESNKSTNSTASAVRQVIAHMNKYSKKLPGDSNALRKQALSMWGNPKALKSNINMGDSLRVTSYSYRLPNIKNGKPTFAKKYVLKQGNKIVDLNYTRLTSNQIKACQSKMKKQTSDNIKGIKGFVKDMKQHMDRTIASELQDGLTEEHFTEFYLSSLYEFVNGSLLEVEEFENNVANVCR